MLLLGPALPREARARIWTVHPNGSGSAPTIRAAVDSAASGDTLDLSAGFFNERIDIRHKTLLIRGRGIDVTELSGYPNGGDYGHAVSLIGADNFTEIRDLTISGGVANVRGDIYNGEYGGGVYGEEAVFALVRCRVTDCRANSLGGGIFATFEPFDRSPSGVPTAGVRSAILLEDCLIDNNIASAAGGGLYTEFAFMEIRNCTFRDNFSVDAGGVGILRAGVLISGCLFQDNRAEFYGGGIRIEQYSTSTSIEITGNTFIANSSGRDGAGVLVSIGSDVLIERNLFALSTGEGGGAAIGCQEPDGHYTGGCNHFWSNGEDLGICASIASDTSGDPLFCDAAGDDFRICANSPALRQDCGTAGAFGIGCDGGDCATAVQPATWSGIKARFR